MRSLLLSLAAILILALPDLAAAQSCKELRRACEMKNELGEQGEGNCRRYREACRQPSFEEVCARLRRACIFKDERGEEGQGNCRRYRDTCRNS